MSDAFPREDLYSLLAFREQLISMSKMQFGIVEKLVKAMDVQDLTSISRIVNYVNSLDLNDEDRKYTMSLVDQALDIKSSALQLAIIKKKFGIKE